MTKDTAKKLSDLMISISHQFAESLGVVEDAESAEDYERYRDAVSKVMMEMLIEIMNPLYAEHPDLKPPELKHDNSDLPE